MKQLPILVCGRATAAQAYQQHLLKLKFIKYFLGSATQVVGTLGYLSALHTNNGSKLLVSLATYLLCNPTTAALGLCNVVIGSIKYISQHRQKLLGS